MRQETILWNWRRPWQPFHRAALLTKDIDLFEVARELPLSVDRGKYGGYYHLNLLSAKDYRKISDSIKGIDGMDNKIEKFIHGTYNVYTESKTIHDEIMKWTKSIERGKYKYPDGRRGWDVVILAKDKNRAESLILNDKK